MRAQGRDFVSLGFVFKGGLLGLCVSFLWALCLKLVKY